MGPSPSGGRALTPHDATRAGPPPRHDSADSRPPCLSRTTRRGTRRSWPPDRAPAPERPDDANPTYPTVTTRRTERGCHPPDGASATRRCPAPPRADQPPGTPRTGTSPAQPTVTTRSRGTAPTRRTARAPGRAGLGPAHAVPFAPRSPRPPPAPHPPDAASAGPPPPHGVGRQPSIPSARLRSISRSRALPARSAARVNSSRASFVRPRRDRRSPLTEGSRW